jgi:Lon-like protease
VNDEPSPGADERSGEAPGAVAADVAGEDAPEDAPQAALDAPGDGPPEAPPEVGADGAPWPLPPPVRRRKAPWILGVIGTVLVVASVVASFVQLPYYTIAPGDALDVNRLVTVHGAKQYPPTGAVMLLFVRERSRINAWRWLQASLDSDIDLIKQRDFAGDADPAEVDAQAVRDMAVSQDAARYVALKRLGYKVSFEKKLRVLAVIGDKPAAGVLQAGDIIASIAGRKITTSDDLTSAMKGKRPGERITIGYIREGRRHDATIRLGHDSKGHPIIGIFLGPPPKFPIEVKINTSDIGGPSAGLAMTLSILDELTPGDLTGGKRIAVTGEIGFDGTVGEVGGVGQKAVAARHRGAALFLVPMAEVAEARSRAGSMPVVGVRTLTDALRALREAGGDPLPAEQSQTAA